MAYDIKQVELVYDSLTAKVKSDLDEQFKLGRIKGSDYATVYAQLMSDAMKLAFQAPINDAQVKLYERQRQGFDDNLKQKLFESQMGAWATMFNSGLLQDKPAVISNDEVSTLYNNMKNQLGIT